jgi:hypothetical protein
MNDPLPTETLDTESEALNCWAFVEIYGHHRIAGRLTTRKVGTEVMFQVDVPKPDEGFSRSELYGPKSIFSIKPTTEAWCRKFIAHATEMQHDVLPYIPDSRQLVAPSEAIESNCPDCGQPMQFCDCEN